VGASLADALLQLVELSRMELVSRAGANDELCRAAC